MKAWKSVDEYVHWMQFLEYMPEELREEAMERFAVQEWPTRAIVPPSKEKEKRRLMALLPDLISHVIENCGSGEKSSGSGNKRCNDVTKGDRVVRVRYTPSYRDGKCTVKTRPGEPQAGKRKRKKPNHRMRKALVKAKR